MKQKELNEILRLHKMWLNDEEGMALTPPEVDE